MNRSRMGIPWRPVILTLRFLPRRLRFRAAAVAAAISSPLIARAARAHRDSSPRAVALSLAVDALSDAEIAFDPRFRVAGAEELRGAAEGGRGVLAVTTHRNAVLAKLFPRYVHELGHAPAAVTEIIGMRVSGTRLPVDSVYPSPYCLVRVRRLLERGRIILAAIDVERGTSRSREIAVGDAQVNVSDSLVQLALRCGAAIVFMEANVSPAGVVDLRLRRSGSADAESVLRDFAAFLRK